MAAHLWQEYLAGLDPHPEIVWLRNCSVATAYILLNNKPNSEAQIISKIKEIVGAGRMVGYEIMGVYGVYDIVVKVSGKDMEDIRDVLGKIRRVDQVISTITMLVNEAQEG